ncbi:MULTISPECIES: hypothetical protein [unclassified Clostridium]|uniref:hypothetical protein n=1 Tax=unclassified Clostridium TaxID=2614128 RepID=UPI0002980102|nr:MULTISPECIES: hypothetical protein [unclassified Clostridium]EKQ57223.1 MAG: hypothetical protein A370_01153 [Clostridium sp. Maddingley MBC34-26]
MNKVKRRKLNLNMKFQKGAVVCAKSPIECKGCRDIGQCEEMDLFYYTYSKKDISECIKNDERRR